MNASAVSIDVDMLAQLPAKSMLRFIEKRQATEKFLGACVLLLRDCPALFLTLEGLEIEPRFDPDCEHVGLSFSGTGDKFGQVWHALRLSGFVPGNRPKAGDTAFSAYWKRDGYPKFLMCLESTVCRRVQVGTRTVEQPVYEVQCGEVLPEVEASEAPPALPAPAAPDLDSDIPF